MRVLTPVAYPCGRTRVPHEVLGLSVACVCCTVPMLCAVCLFFFSSRRRHTRFDCDWSSDVCSSDLDENCPPAEEPFHVRSRMTAWQIMCLRHRVAPAAGPISSDRTLGDGTLKRPMLQIGRAVV